MRKSRVLTLTLSLLAVNLTGISPTQAVADGSIACTGGGTFTVSSNVVTASSNCVSAVIPEGITAIGFFAFSGPNLTSVSIPSSVTSIGEMAFFGANKLTSVTIGNNVTSIGDEAFFGVTLLTSLTIGSSVTSIGVSAFEGANNLTDIYFLGSAPTLGLNAFSPRGSKNAIVNSSNSASFNLTNGKWNEMTRQVIGSVSAPGAPTIGSTTALSPTSASVSFIAPGDDGGAVIETYTATSTPGTVTGTLLQAGSGSITITGLTPSTTYTFIVKASNSAGESLGSSATASITMPASAEELAAQAAAASAAKAAADLAAQKAAEAKREAEKKAARNDISKGFFESKLPTIQQFATAEILGVTEKNFPMISKELMAMTPADRSDIKMVEKISKKYLILDSICIGGKFAQFVAKDLSSVGLIPVENQVVVTYALRQLPLAERENYEKITAAISKELAVIRIRDERLASILALRKSRQAA